jgi:hypothetical protein
MLKNRKFRHRVAVHRADFVAYAAPALAAYLLDTGRAIVLWRQSKVITAIRLNARADGNIEDRIALQELGLQPGSFGIRVETFSNGLWCYGHKHPWDELLCPS